MKLLLIATAIVAALAGAEGVNQAGSLIGGANLRTLVLSILASGTFSVWLSWFLSRRNQSAITRKTNAEADNVVAEVYGEILEDIRQELTRYKQALADQEKACEKKVNDLAAKHQRSIDRAHERITRLEQSEDQAVEHIQNLEERLREVGVPLPETPWRPLPGRRRRSNGNYD